MPFSGGGISFRGRVERRRVKTREVVLERAEVHVSPMSFRVEQRTSAMSVIIAR